MDLEAQCDHLSAIYPVSRETMAHLETYRSLLLRWQAKTNLVAPGTLDAFWQRHVADSLQLFALKPAATQWVDLGSGGGFPGLVIACLLAQAHPNTAASIALVESNHKKAAFLRQVATHCDLPVTVHASRIEAVPELITNSEVITARALAPLARLLAWCGPMLQQGRVALFPKGRDFQREIAECHGRWTFDLIEHPSMTSADSRILEISNVRAVRG